MIRYRSLVVALLLSSVSIATRAQHAQTPVSETPVHYRVYDDEGNVSSFDAVLAAAREADVVMVGEEHNDPIAHWLQAELLKNLLDGAGDRPVALSLEMFERDVQHVVDEYLQGQITETHFKKSARAWSNYDTDYKPMVEAAREAGIPVIAANAPRRYVNRVSREGAESLGELSPRARAWLSPLPYEGPSEEYAAQWNAMMAEQMAEMQKASDEGKDEDDGMGGMGMMHGKKSMGSAGQMCPRCRAMHGDSTSAGMGGGMGMMHGKTSMGAGHGKMMRGDSTGGGMGMMHGKKAMGAGHGKMMMGRDSTGSTGQMCPKCRAMHGDSTSAGMGGGMGMMHGKKAMGAGHGKMMMGRDSTGSGPHQCKGCRHGMGGETSGMGQGVTPGAMPDDEIHRRLRPDADEKAEEKSSSMMSGADGGGMHAAMAGMLDAQALWDATMAHSIATFLEDEPEAIVMHAVGGFHVEYGTGIPEQLASFRPGAKQLVVAIRSADDVGSFDEDDAGRGDFVILTDAALPRSYETRTD